MASATFQQRRIRPRTRREDQEVCNRETPKRDGLTGLVIGIAIGLALFIAGGTWPFLREMVWIFPLTALATFAGLALGTCFFPDTPAERNTVEGFLRQIETPS